MNFLIFGFRGVSGSRFKEEVNQKGKKSVVIGGHIRDHFYIIYKFEGNLNPELQADMSISVYFVNVLIPKVITSYKVFGPYMITSFCSLIHLKHCSFFPQSLICMTLLCLHPKLVTSKKSLIHFMWDWYFPWSLNTATSHLLN